MGRRVTVKITFSMIQKILKDEDELAEIPLTIFDPNLSR
jgi:hypothetical protein